jgi:hypothetical protein
MGEVSSVNRNIVFEVVVCRSGCIRTRSVHCQHENC